MAQRPVDLDQRQALKDVFARNAYRIVDDYVIRDGKTHPVAFLVPGGGYAMVCSFMEGVPIAKKLNEKGISCIIVYYRVKKKAKYPAPLDDLGRAIRTVFSQALDYHIDVRNYSVWGASAGGHLTAAFGTKHMGYERLGLPKPGTLVLSYPVISMRKDMSHGTSRLYFLGQEPTEADEAFGSVDEHVDADYPPTYLWYSETDAQVNPENSKRMKAALEEAGVPYECKAVTGVDHGVGPGTGTVAEGWIDEAVDFWLKQGEAKD